MKQYEVPEPILNSPYLEPSEFWHIVEGELPKRIKGRRPARYYYRPPVKAMGEAPEGIGTEIELKIVNRIRERLKEWLPLALKGQGGVSGVTFELLNYWRREGREPNRFFFAQLEAAETIIFLNEARADFLQGITVPLDEPSEDRKAERFRAFRRYANKMATGTGKTTVMGMILAWSILNKINNRNDGRFSDAVLVVCPNVTIRSRLQELYPERGEGSIYRTRDIVPPHLMPDLIKGKVFITNWHVFEPQIMQTGGVSARVAKTGVPVRTVESITISNKTTTARGIRYLTPHDLARQVDAGILTIIDEDRDRQGNLRKVRVESVKYVESDTALLNRVLGREIGNKQNILVINDEAHHAYRIRKPEPEEYEEDLFGEEEEVEEFFKEATVWIEGLDRVHKYRGINFCVDLSATPYFLGRMGPDSNRIFPWVVSEFGLTDAIESGLTKIPQLAVRDTTGKEIPGYFNIWRWILPHLTSSEKGGRKESPKPEAILKWANTPIVMLAGLWEELRREWEENGEDPRPPVFILVCKNTKIAKVIYDWLAENMPPAGIPSANIEGFLNSNGSIYTIRVDSKVVHETDTGEAKSDESRWMRFTLDTVGKLDWPRDRHGKPLYPEGFEELAKKMNRQIHPPGRNIRCIVSVGMLTEGWDCNTVTHIIGLRPFMSQLLCEQVVGRGLRRSSYEVKEDGKLTEEVAKVFGVPFEVIPFKETGNGPKEPPLKHHHVYAVPEKSLYEIRFPRIEGYTQAIHNKIKVDWNEAPRLILNPADIPPEVQMKAGLPSNQGRPSLLGPGKLISVDLNPYRSGRRFQELVFEIARDLTRTYMTQPDCEAPSHVLFPQIIRLVEHYLKEYVTPVSPANIIDVFLSPYYGWVIENLMQVIRPDTLQGEAPEVAIYEASRGPGSTAEVDFWTSKEVREVIHSHLNYMVADTKRWEQSAAYYIDRHPVTFAFAKNQGLGFAIPYFYNGQNHDYLPDFLIKLNFKDNVEHYLILETKGFDELESVKTAAAYRWVSAVNTGGRFGKWRYTVIKKPEEINRCLDAALNISSSH
jgi:type III restriction enzyme